MRAFTLILATACCYVLLADGFFESFLVVRIALSSLLTLVALGYFLVNWQTKASHFTHFRKFGIAEKCFTAVLLLLLFSFIFAWYYKGPKLTQHIHLSLSNHFGIQPSNESSDNPFDESLLDELNQPNDSKIQQPENNETPEAKLVNDEESNLTVPERCKIKLSAEPELYLEPFTTHTLNTLKKETIYLKSRTLSHFDGVNWKAPKGEIEYKYPIDNTWIHLSQTPEAGELIYKIRQHHDKYLMHAIPRVDAVSVASLKHFSKNKYILPPHSSDGKIRTYVCRSSYKNFKNLLKEKTNVVGESIQEDAHEIYLNKNYEPQLRRIIQQVVEPFKVYASDIEKLSAIKNYFDDTTSYSLEIENPAGVNGIENFLLHEKKGFCIHYATATALMCRELEIPSRIAIGFVGGDYFPSEQQFVFYTKNLHAWVEVQLGNHGWVVFDTAPPQTRESRQLEETASLPPFKSRSQIKKERLNSKKKSSNKEQKAQKNYAFEQIKVLFVIIVVLLIILMALGVWQRKERAKRDHRENHDDERHYVKEKKYITLFRKYCQLNGVPMMSGDTLLYHITKLKSLEKSPDFADELIEYHYQTTYNFEKEDKKRESLLIKNIKKWKL